METSVTSILQQLRALEELVIHHRMTTEELHGLELELRTIVERLDAIRIISKRSQADTKADFRRHKKTGQVRGDAKGLGQKDIGD